jgi:hypothetical protein
MDTDANEKDILESFIQDPETIIQAHQLAADFHRAQRQAQGESAAGGIAMTAGSLARHSPLLAPFGAIVGQCGRSEVTMNRKRATDIEDIIEERVQAHRAHKEKRFGAIALTSKYGQAAFSSHPLFEEQQHAT